MAENLLPLYDEKITISEDTETINFQTEISNSSRPYRLAFYLEKSEPGTDIWMDNVRLVSPD